MQKKFTEIKVASVAILVATTSPLLVQASGLEKHLYDPVVVKAHQITDENCLPGSQKGNKIDTSNLDLSRLRSGL